ncbi:MAG: TolC family protein [Prosthecochloris sp.]|nr:TolC family protein [Prosthecochloris sp.]
MKHICKPSQCKAVVLLFWCLLLMPLHLTAADLTDELPEGTLTATEVKQLALERNPSLGQALARVRTAEAILRQAYSAWWPEVTATGGYTRNYADIQPDWQPDTTVVKRFYELRGGLELNWLLFDGFARRAETLAARHSAEEARLLEENTRRLLLESVSTAYRQSQLALEQMRIARRNMLFNRSLEQQASVKYRVGTAPKSEMLNFSVRALQAEHDYIEAERSFTVAIALLAELTGHPAEEPLDRLYPEPVLTEEDVPEILPDESSLLAEALQNRPDLKAIGEAVRAAEYQKNAAKGAWGPVIGLNAGVNYLKQTDILPEQEEVTAYAGIGAEWKLFTGGRRSAVFQEKKAGLFALEEERRSKELAIASSVRQARANLEAAMKSLKLQQEAYLLTQTIRNDIEKLYSSGAASITRLNEAQTDLVKAAGLAASARIQYELAKEKLKLETGTDEIKPRD